MVRMWMIKPIYLCRQHLLGEHNELHKLLGSIVKGKSIRGHSMKFQVFPKHLVGRHNELVIEMQRRGYNHNSPMPIEYTCLIHYLEIMPQHSMPPTLVVDNMCELYKKCESCKERMETLGYSWNKLMEHVRC